MYDILSTKWEFASRLRHSLADSGALMNFIHWRPVFTPGQRPSWKRPRFRAIVMTGYRRAAGRLNLSHGIETHQQVQEVAMVGLDDGSVNGGADLGNARML